MNRKRSKHNERVNDGEKSTGGGGGGGRAFSMLLREHQEKNCGLMVTELRKCDHVIFFQIYIIDLVAQYAAMFYPEYSKMPSTGVRRIQLAQLCGQLMQRPESHRYNDHRRHHYAMLTNTLYWNATPYIMDQIRPGQLGYFSKKGHGFANDCQYPFVVVWTHPAAKWDEDEDECIPIIGVIFPALLAFDILPLTGETLQEWWWQQQSSQKTLRWGGDISMLHGPHSNAVARIDPSHCTCKSVKIDAHRYECPNYESFAFESERLRQHEAYRKVPDDGYYKVHYFAFWAEAPNESGSEVSQSHSAPPHQNIRHPT